MNDQILHIVHLPKRLDRKAAILKELAGQEIGCYRFWDGIVDQTKVATGISRAHKQIVQYAKERKLPYVMIAEDDIEFTAPGAFKYFCDHRPNVYDLYLGAISYGKINAENHVNDFSGLLLYQVHERFYDLLLSTPESEHLDRVLRGRGLYVVCPQFVVIEKNGFSDNSNRVEDPNMLFANRPLFDRPPIRFE